MNAVDIYIHSLPEKYVFTAETTRDIILAQSPKITEHLKYNIPFYHYKNPFCYINYNKQGKMYLGFVNGHLLADEEGVLEGEELKLVRHFPLTEDNVIHRADVLASFIQESILLKEKSWAIE